jgi:Flp pilus assembly protein TadG
MLPFLMALLLTGIEVAERQLELAQIEDALRQAARSAAQSFAYERFAEGATGLDEARALEIARAVFHTNLAGVRGLAESRDATAARVVWTVLPAGGTCHFANGRPAAHANAPMVCATLRPQMRGLLGWGTWSPQIDAVEILD